jgi:hypothetical protein
MILYKLGLFGIDWDHTPFLDNKASFQRGINQAIRRTTTEPLTIWAACARLHRSTTICRMHAATCSSMRRWYFGLQPFGPKTPTPSYYRDAIAKLRTFNDRLQKCEAVFDARSDNLKIYLDRVASDIGSTSALLKERAENYNYGFFDPRADDRFWFAYGQLYAYYGLMKAAEADFEDVIKQRNLTSLYQTMDAQFVAALKIQPFLIANSREDGLFASHLTTMGFYILRVRSNMVEISNVLAQ